MGGGCWPVHGAWQGRGLGGGMAQGNVDIWWLMTEQELGLFPGALVRFGEPRRAGCRDDCVSYENVKFARSPLVTVFQSSPQLPASTVIITEPS